MFNNYFLTSENPRTFYLIFFQDWNFTPFGCPDNQILLHFGIPDNKILLRFGVPDNQILLHLGGPNNFSSGPGMAGRIYSLNSYRGHQNGIKFGCRGHQTK